MKHRFAVLTALLLVATSHPVIAQNNAGPRAGLSQPDTLSRAPWSPSFAKDSVAPNQWEKGALIGGGIGLGLGLLFTAWANAVDDTQSSHSTVLVGSVVICALIGGMIGSFSRKP